MHDIMVDSTPDLQTVNNAKNEYLTSLHKIISPFVLKFLNDTYCAAEREHGTRKATREFQRELLKVPEWNHGIVQQRTSDIESKHPVLANLIAAVFVAFIKILSSIRISSQRPTMKLKVPSSDKFMHRVYILAAKKFYETPGLIRDSEDEKRAVLFEATENAVRDMLPMEEVLSQYLSKAVDEDNTVDAVVSPVPSDDEAEGIDADLRDDDSDGHEPPKIIEYAPPPHPQPPPPPPQLSSYQPENAESFAPQTPAPPDVFSQPQPQPAEQPVAAPAPQTQQQPQQQTYGQPLFPDARDGEEHFR